MGKPANASADCSINNIYRLEGRVPIGKAIPFGLQHILAMFVSNLAPITIIAGAAQPALSQTQVAILPVSYTHLDVYKRQGIWCAGNSGNGD